MNKHFRPPAQFHVKLSECGLDVTQILRRAGLATRLFEQPRVALTTEEFFAFWRAIGETSADPAVGVRLGTENKTERFHASGLAALSAPSFGAAVDHLSRYKRLVCPEAVVQKQEDSEWHIQFHWLLAVDIEPYVLTEYCFAWVLNLARHGSGEPINPLRIELTQPRAHRRALERHFGCEVVCNAPHNAMVFAAEHASLPFITRNSELLELLAPQLDAELKKTTAQDTFVELVRAAIRQRLAGSRPAVEDIARELYLSPRTLQRRLQESGASFQRVLDDARHQMARYYLGNSVLELNEAAYLLGYEDTNSFVRAFRTWEGIPPGAWRETHRVGTQRDSSVLQP
jgi:AraC-like DNA-binding protein